MNSFIPLQNNGSEVDSTYSEVRPNIGHNYEDLVKLESQTMFGLHPKLEPLKELWNENKLGILITNNEKNSQTIFKLNLLDISEDNISIPPAEFDTELSLPSGDFQKIIRDMINIGENIEIKSIGNQLILNCDGDFASQETILSEPNNSDGLQFKQTTDNALPTQGEFSLKYLILFTKCTNLCQQINLYIKNDYPLIIRYLVASLGDIKLCLAPNSN